MINKYAYTDSHQLNLDWILEKIHELDKTVDDSVRYIQANLDRIVNQRIDEYIRTGEMGRRVQEALDRLDPRLSNVESAISVLPRMFNNLRNKNMILFTNSYGSNIGGDPTFPTYLSAQFGINMVKAYVQRRGDFIAKGGDAATLPGATYDGCVDDLLDNILTTQAQRNEIDYIIFAGGWNDAHQILYSVPPKENPTYDDYKDLHTQLRSDLFTQIRDVSARLATAFPNAEIHFFPLSVPPKDNVGVSNAREQISILADYWGYRPSMLGRCSHPESLYWFSASNANLTYTDNIHPSVAGNQRIAYMIASVLAGYSGVASNQFANYDIGFIQGRISQNVEVHVTGNIVTISGIIATLDAHPDGGALISIPWMARPKNGNNPVIPVLIKKGSDMQHGYVSVNEDGIVSLFGCSTGDGTTQIYISGSYVIM